MYVQTIQQHSENTEKEWPYLYTSVLMKYKLLILLRYLYNIGLVDVTPLEGDRKGEYAMDLVHPYRLIFEKNKTDVELVRIINIEDYH